jgi:hypothetical protein
MQASTTMPSSSFAGAKIPLNSTDLEQTKKEEESKLPDNIDAIHRDNVRRTGLSGVAPVKTDTTLPAIATANEALVNAQLEPTVLGSIPERAAAFDEHVRAWASADKPIGEARENPLRVVEDMVARLSLGAGCSRLRSGSGAGVAAQRTYPIALQLRDYSGRVI